MVNAHSALQSRGFHVSGKRLEGKAWGWTDTVLRMRTLVACCTSEETLERVNHTLPCLLYYFKSLPLGTGGRGKVANGGHTLIETDIADMRWFLASRHFMALQPFLIR